MYFVFFSFVFSLPLTFKPSDRTHDRYTLIHYYFSNVEVSGDPRLCGLVVCDFVLVYTWALCVRYISDSFLLFVCCRVCVVEERCVEDGRGGLECRRGEAHVRPVERFTPARKAEMRTASNA